MPYGKSFISKSRNTLSHALTENNKNTRIYDGSSSKKSQFRVNQKPQQPYASYNVLLNSNRSSNLQVQNQEKNLLSIYSNINQNSSEKRLIKKQAVELIKSFQTSQPRFIKFGDQKRDDDNSDEDEKLAFYKADLKVNKKQKKDEILINMIQERNINSAMSQLKFYKNSNAAEQKNQLYLKKKRQSTPNMIRNSSVRSVMIPESPSIPSQRSQKSLNTISKKQLLTIGKSSPKRTFMTNRVINNYDRQNNLDDYELKALYNAKCKDLHIPEVEDQFLKFKENCLANSMTNILKFHKFNFGPFTAQVIAQIMINNHNFSQYILSDNFIGNDGILHIANALKETKHIIKIDISSNGITHDGIEILFDCIIENQSIIDINLSSKEGNLKNRIQSKGVLCLKRVLSENPFIQILNLSGNSIKNEGLKYLCEGIIQSQTKNLISLDISNNEINQHGCDKINQLLEHSNILKLNISGNNIGNGGIEKISPVLFFSRSKVQYLDISECNIQHQGLLIVLDAIKHNYTIKNLIMDGNKGLKSHSFTIMQALMGQNRCLQYFSFVNCNIDDTFAIPLGIGLNNNLKLKTLNLSNNLIGDDGASTIANALSLKSLSQMIELNLSRNFIHDDGGLSLSYMIKNNKILIKCNLSYNSMGEKAGEDFTKSINYNDTIQFLDLNNNQFNLKYVSIVEEKCKKNKLMKQKNQVPEFQQDLRQLSNVKVTLQKVQKRLKRMDVNWKRFSENYHNELDKFEKFKEGQERESSIVQNEVSIIKEAVEGLDSQCQELLKYEKVRIFQALNLLQEKDQELAKEYKNLRNKIQNLQINNKQSQKQIFDTKNQVQSKVKTYQNDINFYKRSLNDVQIQANIMESKFISLRAEKLTVNINIFPNNLQYIRPNDHQEKKEANSFITNVISPGQISVQQLDTPNPGESKKRKTVGFSVMRRKTKLNQEIMKYNNQIPTTDMSQLSQNSKNTQNEGYNFIKNSNLLQRKKTKANARITKYGTSIGSKKSTYLSVGQQLKQNQDDQSSSDSFNSELQDAVEIKPKHKTPKK